MDKNGQLINVYELNALYKSFPPFLEWQQVSFKDNRWNKYKKRLEEKKSKYGDLMSKALQTIETATAIDTGALEGLYETDRGFTFSVAAEGALWQVAFEEKKGHKATELVKAQLEAYEYVLDLATQKEPITQARIRELHEIVCRNQEVYQTYNQFRQLQNVPLEKGKYKIHSNHPQRSDGTAHAYAPVDITPMEMQKLTDELQSDIFQAAHPILQASYAHYAFVCIHPFPDGNGRVARALAAVYTYRAASIPLLILSEKRRLYLDALEAADAGDFVAFVDFILESALDTMKYVEDSIETARTTAASESLKKLEALSITQSGYTHEQIDNAANALQKMIYDEIKAQTSAIKSNILQISVSESYANIVPKAGYRRVGNQGKCIGLAAQTQKLLKNVNYGISIHCEVPIDSGLEDDILVFTQSGERPPKKEETMAVRVNELLPEVSPSLKSRIEIRVKGVVNEFIEETQKSAESANKGGN